MKVNMLTPQLVDQLKVLVIQVLVRKGDRLLIRTSAIMELEEVSKVHIHKYKSNKLKDHAKILQNVAEANPKRIERIVKSIPTPTDVKNFTSEEPCSFFFI